MRRIPSNIAVPRFPQLEESLSNGNRLIRCTIQLVTPLFGGGPVPGEADEVTRIRGTSVRGHLRNWWRFFQRAKFHDSMVMFQREAEIFGSVESASPVVVRIEQPHDQQALRRQQDNYGFDRFGPEAYALFSARQNSKDLIREGASFALELEFSNLETLQAKRRVENELLGRKNLKLLPTAVDDIESDICRALWAWVTFGGIGARTRRGCGSLYCHQWPDKVSEQVPRNWPGPALLAGAPCADALVAWRGAVKIYQSFRQGFRGPKHDKPLPNGRLLKGIPGRSDWPEPDSIRRLTGSAAKRPRDHTVPTVPMEAVPTFPRAVLGLPINFHFADGPGSNSPASSQKDPADVQLVPNLGGGSGSEARLASPVITKAVFHNGAWVPLVAILSDKHVTELSARLVGDQANAHERPPRDMDVPIRNAQIQGSQVSNLKPLSGHSDALHAFIAYARQNGFKDVSL